MEKAIRYGYLELVIKLLEEGRDPNTPLEGFENFNVCPIHRAAEVGHVGITRELLRWGADPNILTFSRFPGLRNSPLFWAHNRGNWGVILELLRWGADPLQGFHGLPGNTLLHHVCHKHDSPIAFDIVCELLKTRIDVNHRNVLDNTALHHAARWGNRDIIVALLKKGARIDIPNINDNTPLDYAKMYCDPETIKIVKWYKLAKKMKIMYLAGKAIQIFLSSLEKIYAPGGRGYYRMIEEFGLTLYRYNNFVGKTK